MESGSLEAEDASSLPPASESQTSDHDSTGDDSEKVASFSEVQVVEVAPATSSSSVLSVPHIDICNAGVPADTAQPQKSHDDLKLKVANMPVLRLKMLKTKSSRADFFHSDQKRVLVLNGLVLCYFEPTKHTDYPEQKAKGYLPLWMLSKVEADVSLAIPQFSLHYGTDTFTFKARKRFPDPARDFVTELLSRCDFAQKCGIMTECPSEPKWHAEDKHATVFNRLYMTCQEESEIHADSQAH